MEELWQLMVESRTNQSLSEHQLSSSRQMKLRATFLAFLALCGEMMRRSVLILQEKQKMKVKEKLDKCIKEKLLEICDVLDIPIAKSIKSTKKDDIVAKLIDFLLVPHATTTVLLAEKEQSSKGKKRGRDGSASRSLGTSPKRAVKSRKKSKDSKREVDKSTSDTEDASEEEDKEAGNGVPERSEDEISENSERKEKNDASEESEEDTIKAKKGSKRNSAKKYSADKGKNTEITTPKRSTTKVKGTPKRSSSNPPKVSHDADTSPKVFSRKKKNDRGDEEKAPVSKRSASKEKSASSEWMLSMLTFQTSHQGKKEQRASKFDYGHQLLLCPDISWSSNIKRTDERVEDRGETQFGRETRHVRNYVEYE